MYKRQVLLRKAYGQARSYITHLPGDTPPYILVLDIGRTILVWDRWQGSFGGFGAGKRIDLTRLHERPEDIRREERRDRADRKQFRRALRRQAQRQAVR